MQIEHQAVTADLDITRELTSDELDAVAGGVVRFSFLGLNFEIDGGGMTVCDDEGANEEPGGTCIDRWF